jgi:hypothetical protein
MADSGRQTEERSISRGQVKKATPVIDFGEAVGDRQLLNFGGASHFAGPPWLMAKLINNR